MQWPEIGEPPDGYVFSTVSLANGAVSHYESVTGNRHIEALMVWMYQRFVHRVPGDRVYVDEGMGFIVHNAKVQPEPFWNGAVTCFNVSSQEEEVILFLKENR